MVYSYRVIKAPHLFFGVYPLTGKCLLRSKRVRLPSWRIKRFLLFVLFYVRRHHRRHVTYSLSSARASQLSRRSPNPAIAYIPECYTLRLRYANAVRNCFILYYTKINMY